MKQELQKQGLFPAFLLILILISGCSDNNSESFSIGDKYLNGQTTITVIDTFSLGFSTVLIDSISTTNPENFLVGSFTDEYFGKMEASSWFQIDRSDSLAINENSVFDSLTIKIRLNGLSWGDTLAPYTLAVHRITETMEEPDELNFYNTTEFQYDQTPLGVATFKPRPNIDKEIEIKLNDALGAELMKLLLDNADEIGSTDDFLEYFNGLVLLGGDENKSVLSLNATDSLLTMELYTHFIGEEREEIEYTFPLYSTGACFNHIQGDRTGTEVEKLLTQKEEIPAGETGNKTFIQGGTGIVTRIDFASLSKIMEIENRYVFYKAELIFKPLPLSNKQMDYPEEIIMYSTDKWNQMVSLLADSEGEAVKADYSFDSQYNESNYYKIDITDYVNNELSDAWVDPNGGLIMRFPDESFESSLDRVVFDVRSADAYRPLLKLYFVFYQ